MSAPEAVSDATGPSKVIIVGGAWTEVRGTMRKNLESVGVEVVDFWETPKAEATIPEGVAVICLIDLCSHSSTKRTQLLAEQSNALFLRGGRKWSFLRGVLKAHGMVRPPLQKGSNMEFLAADPSGAMPKVPPGMRILDMEGVANFLDTSPLSLSLASPVPAVPLSPPPLPVQVMSDPVVPSKAAPAASASLDRFGAPRVKVIRARICPNSVGGLYLLEVVYEGGKKQAFGLGRLTPDNEALCKVGIFAILGGKSSSSGVSIDSILDLAKSTAHSREEIDARRDILVGTLVDIGRKERQSENPLLPHGQLAPSRSPALSPLPPKVPDTAAAVAKKVPGRGVFETLKAEPGVLFTPGMLASRLGWRMKTVRRELARLEKEGQIARQGVAGEFRWLFPEPAGRRSAAPVEPVLSEPAKVEPVKAAPPAAVATPGEANSLNLHNRGKREDGKIRSSLRWTSNKKPRTIAFEALDPRDFAEARQGLLAIRTGTSAARGLTVGQLLASPELAQRRLISVGRGRLHDSLLPAPEARPSTKCGHVGPDGLSCVREPGHRDAHADMPSPIEPLSIHSPAGRYWGEIGLRGTPLEPQPPSLQPPAPQEPTMAVSPSSPFPQPSDTELRRLVAELQAVMQQRPDLLEIVIPKAGAPRVRQQVVVETEWK